MGDHGPDHLPAVHTCPAPPPMPRKPGRRADRGDLVLYVVTAIVFAAAAAAVIIGFLLHVFGG